jgi:hypothetical protein
LKRRPPPSPLPPGIIRPGVLPPPAVVIPIGVLDGPEHNIPAFISPTGLDLPALDTFDIDWKDRQMGLFDMAGKYDTYDPSCPPMSRDNYRLEID